MLRLNFLPTIQKRIDRVFTYWAFKSKNKILHPNYFLLNRYVQKLELQTWIHILPSAILMNVPYNWTSKPQRPFILLIN